MTALWPRLPSGSANCVRFIGSGLAHSQPQGPVRAACGSPSSKYNIAPLRPLVKTPACNRARRGIHGGHAPQPSVQPLHLAGIFFFAGHRAWRAAAAPAGQLPFRSESDAGGRCLFIHLGRMRHRAFPRGRGRGAEPPGQDCAAGPRAIGGAGRHDLYEHYFSALAQGRAFFQPRGRESGPAGR